MKKKTVCAGCNRTEMKTAKGWVAIRVNAQGNCPACVDATAETKK